MGRHSDWRGNQLGRESYGRQGDRNYEGGGVKKAGRCKLSSYRVTFHTRTRSLSMTAAYTGNGSTGGVVLHLAFELGWTHWRLAFTIGHGQKARQRTMRARDLGALEQEIAKAKRRFQSAEDAPVVSCYEAERDGFWLHRYLTARGVSNVIVDSASIGEEKGEEKRTQLVLIRAASSFPAVF